LFGVRSVKALLKDAYRRFWASETLIMLTMAVLVGVGSGFGAVAFRRLIDVAGGFFLDTLIGWVGFLGRYGIIIAPTLGGLLAGLVIHLLSSESAGPGVAPVMEAMALRGGRIRPIVIAAKPIATAITLGSGGAGGREGPIVLIGSAIGSAVSQVTRLSDKRMRSLVAAGAAGGIAATFNAPLAGVMFAIEILLAKFALTQFTSVVVTAVIASFIGHAYFGDAPAFPVPPSTPPSGWEMPIYVLLGVSAAFVGVGFTRLLHWVDDVFSDWEAPPYLRPAAGGALVGVVGVWFPRVLGGGYDSIEAVLFNRLTLSTIVILGLLKLVVASLTIGSGGSGGIFGPCLFIGAMLGGAFGQLAQQLTPGSPPASLYPLVGMSAVFGAASHAPVTAILTIFEMTRDYNAVLPLMLSTVISAVLARKLFRESIFTVKLARHGIDVRAGRDLDLMSTILVKEAMTPIDKMSTVTPETPLVELASLFEETHHHGVVVVDQHRRLQGVVTLSDLEQAQAQQLMRGEVSGIQTTNVRTAYPDETLEEALRHFGVLDVGRVPVVDRGDPTQVVGILRRGDIVRAYSHAYMDEQARLAHMDRAKLEDRTGKSMLEIKLRERHRVVGKTIQDLHLPPRCLIVSIRRGGRVLIPQGDTQLEAGDVVVALVPDEEEATLRARLTGSDRRHHTEGET